MEAKPHSGMKKRWVPEHKRFLWVCTTCGGNCGQCGDTSRYNALNDGLIVPASIDTLASFDKPQVDFMKNFNIQGAWWLILALVVFWGTVGFVAWWIWW